MAPLGTILASATAVNLAAGGFSYHDNAVRFRNTIKTVVNNFVIEDETLDTGTFTVNEFSISSGQDPKTKNHIGDVHTMEVIESNEENGYAKLVDWKSDHMAYPGFVFTAGRHKTAEVADFWNTRIAATQTTFNHTARELNFAFIGDLTLDSDACGHIILPDIGLAQGSDDNGSNWWFGGKSCIGIGSHKVTCQGHDSTGAGLDATFHRGGSGQVNDIFIDECRKH